ncbi:MAG: amino acid-binding protein [Candidatus Dormibacteraeota bacterium]|nr:amino acid-binding protein [Candidatus Dormibacteraeota bacterium]
MARDLSVRLAEDRPGEFARVVQALTHASINIEGIAEVNGVVHVLARDPNSARSALRAGGYQIEAEREVYIMPMPDRPGELAMALQRLADANVNVNFVYLATETRVVIGSDDIVQARELLQPANN